MGDISEGVARKKYGEKIRVFFAVEKSDKNKRDILRPVGSYFVTLEKNWQPKTSEI
jgi:hypothetical protein